MTAISMPQLGETVVEGTIIRWLKREGETVAQDEPLFEISTDKVDTEVPSPAAGTLTKILVPEGETVGVGTQVAEIESAGAAGAASAASPTAPAQAPPPAESPPAESPPAESPAGRAASPAAAAAIPDRGPSSGILSPLVRRLASEHGIDLSRVPGTGAGGRITKADVMAFVAAGTAGTAAAPVAAPASPPPEPAPAARATAPAISPQAAGAGEDVQPISHIRRAIGEHMLASTQQTARAWTMVEVNVEHLVRLRESAREAFHAKHGVKLTYLPFVVRATVDALQAFPQVNGRLDGDDVVLPRYVNMGIAVSYDAGLIVPVIKGADAMNSVGIARAIADLAARARAHQLKPDEVHGATFTITNPGPYGSTASVPIINQPNTGILSLDAIVKRPVVIDDAIAIRHMVNVSMSWDHRTIDGELATRFLARIRQNLESWDFAEDLGI
jgi:2-oxoglutarate dehydrogenase dihydrolipoamide succinyltransferase (E2 component)